MANLLRRLNFLYTYYFLFNRISNGQYITFKAHEFKEDSLDLYFYEKTTITFPEEIESFLDEQNKDLAWCRIRCARTQPRCRNVKLIQVNSNNLRCIFYDVDGTVARNQESSRSLITINMIQDIDVSSSGYCSELDYLNICGNCNCVDLYSPNKSPYYCDCRQTIPVKKSCKEILDEDNYAVSGMYNIKPDEGNSFNVYCFFRKSATGENEAMVRFIRRVDKSEDVLGDSYDYYYNNLNNLHKDSMLGLNYASRLTASFALDLVINQVDKYGNSYFHVYSDVAVRYVKEEYNGYDYEGFTMSATPPTYYDGSDLRWGFTTTQPQIFYKRYRHFYGHFYWFSDHVNPLMPKSFASFRVENVNSRTSVDQQIIFYLKHK